MTQELMFKNADFIKEIGYANNLDKLSDKKIQNFYLRFSPSLSKLKRMHLNKELELDPAFVINLIYDVVSNDIMFKSPNANTLTEKIITANKYNTLVMSPFNFLFQDILDVVYEGTYRNFKKYAYTLDREYVISTFNHKNYTTDLKLHLPQKQTNAQEIPVLLSVLGIEELVYVLLLLVNAGYYDGSR